MRHFVLCENFDPLLDSYILAEVAGDVASDRTLSAGAALAGARSLVVTRAELERTATGRRALARWDDHDDSTFDAESAALDTTDRSTAAGRLRLISGGKTTSDDQPTGGDG